MSIILQKNTNSCVHKLVSILDSVTMMVNETTVPVFHQQDSAVVHKS